MGQPYQYAPQPGQRFMQYMMPQYYDPAAIRAPAQLGHGGTPNAMMTAWPMPPQGQGQLPPQGPMAPGIQPAQWVNGAGYEGYYPAPGDFRSGKANNASQ